MMLFHNDAMQHLKRNAATCAKSPALCSWKSQTFCLSIQCLTSVVVDYLCKNGTYHDSKTHHPNLKSGTIIIKKCFADKEIIKKCFV